jgi:hypothetical protein
MTTCGRDDLLFAFAVSMNMMVSVLIYRKINTECDQSLMRYRGYFTTARSVCDDRCLERVERTTVGNNVRQTCLLIPTSSALMLDLRSDTRGENFCNNIVSVLET